MQSQHYMKIVDLTNQGNYVDLEEYLRINQLPQSIFSQALVECLQYTRDSEEHFQCIQQILKQSIDFNFKDQNGNTALVQAAKSGKISILNEIIKYKEKINKKLFKQALDEAIQSEQDNWDVVETLLQITSLEKPQHLIKSMQKGNYKTASKIIEQYGVSGQDENGDTALHIAARKGNLILIKMICQKEALFQKKNKSGQIPIDVSLNEEVKKQIQEEEISFQKSPNRKRKQEEIQEQKKIEEEVKEFKPTKIIQYNEQETQTEIQMQIKKDIGQQFPEKQLFTNSPFYQQLIHDSEHILPQHKINFDDIIKQLTFEINTFAQELTKYQEEQKPIIDKLVQMVDENIQLVCNKSRSFLYGSCLTGLNLLDSDIDIVVENVDCDDSRVVLYKIAEQFRVNNKTIKMQSFIKEVQVITTARMPVVKMQCTNDYFNKQIDITITRSDHLGRRTAAAMLEFQKCFSQLRSLSLVLKFYFKSINLLNSYQGGLNSYSLVTMIIALLQIKNFRETDNDEIGKTFLDFFDLYSQDLDYYNKIISINPPHVAADMPNIYQKQYPQFGEVPLRLQIIDYNTNISNIASSTKKIKEIKNALSFGYTTILNAQKCEQNCFFSGYNKPVCCILKQVIQQSKNNHLNGTPIPKQPFYYFPEDFTNNNQDIYHIQ